MRRLVLVLFFLSGACGLVYEVVWTRLMTHVFGTTALAVGTVLAAFMAGLAIGSWLLGRAADRTGNPLRLYAVLEIGVGLSALAAHLLLLRITPAYLFVYELFGRSDTMLGVARFVLAFVLVMAPTILMGGTLPVLARFVVQRLSVVGSGLSTLYALNTIGAVAGTLVAGFFLIGTLGLNGTVVAAMLGNVAIGVAALVVSRRPSVTPATAAPVSGEETEPVSAEAVEPGLRRLLLWGLAISGLTSFSYEIYWTRSLVFQLGNSTYAVTTMLTAFLSGIALGGYLIRFLVDRIRRRVALFGWIQVSIAVTAAIALPVLFTIAESNAIRQFLGGASAQSGLLLLTRFGLAWLVMLVPATLIGATFPLVGRIGVMNLGRTGSSVGLIYAINTLGNVAGALLPGLFLLSWFGIQRGVLIMAALNACVGIAVLLARHVRVTRLLWALPVVFVATAFVLTRTYPAFQFPSENESSWHRVLFYREGPSATTKVIFDPDTRAKSMSVDGIDIGGTGSTDYKQKLLAHLPKLLTDDVSVELSVGLGSGILTGESLRHQRVARIACVEIEPSVVEGAAYFAGENHHVLEDSRLRVIVDDVASHLRTTSDSYQVISADEKTAQDYASNGFSYSREYYELLRECLAPGGLTAQWVPTTLPGNQYRMILRTFSEVFPHTQLWYFAPALKAGAANTVLVGSHRRIELQPDRIGARLAAAPEAFEGLVPYGLTTAEAVLAQFVAEGDVLREAVRNAPANTLDRPRYEFFSPSDYETSRNYRLAVNLGFLAELREKAAAEFRSAQASYGEMSARLSQTIAAESEFLAAYRDLMRGQSRREILPRLEQALAGAPWNDNLRARLFLHYSLAAAESTSPHSRQMDYRGAADLMARAMELYGKSAIERVNYSLVLSRAGDNRQALEQARIAVQLDPDLVAARRILAQFLVAAGRPQDAKEQLDALLRIEPRDREAMAMLYQLKAPPAPRRR